MRHCLPRLSIVDMDPLSPNENGIVLITRQIDPEQSEPQFIERVADLLPPELLFSDDIRSSKAIYSELRDFINRSTATIPIQSAHRIVCKLAKSLFYESEKRETADKLPINITRGRSSTPTTTVASITNKRSQTKPPKTFAQNIFMRLRGEESKFSENKTDCWNE